MNQNSMLTQDFTCRSTPAVENKCGHLDERFPINEKAVTAGGKIPDNKSKGVLFC